MGTIFGGVVLVDKLMLKHAHESSVQELFSMGGEVLVGTLIMRMKAEYKSVFHRRQGSGLDTKYARESSIQELVP